MAICQESVWTTSVNSIDRIARIVASCSVEFRDLNAKGFEYCGMWPRHNGVDIYDRIDE